MERHCPFCASLSLIPPLPFLLPNPAFQREENEHESSAFMGKLHKSKQSGTPECTLDQRSLKMVYINHHTLPQTRE